VSRSTTFALDQPVPAGRAVLEASAGTGKTYAIAGLVTRLLGGDDPAEPLTPEQLLVVTFTRSAAAELRDRIRKRLAAAVAHLRRDRFLDEGDPLRGPLEAGGPEVSAARLANLQRALVDLDNATIGTIHAFCAQLLRLGGLDAVRLDDDRPDDTSALVNRVTRDRLIALGLQPGGRALLERAKEADVRKAALAALSAAAGSRVPTPWLLEPGHPARVRAELALAAVGDVAAHRARTGTLSFDEQLTQALELVRGSRGADLAATVQQRFRAVLVDEFQDTDPVQWAVFDTLFPAGGSARLLLVGDPKQSIYAFRGADVAAYREALGSAGTRRTLGVNRRSDAPLVTALNHLLRGTTFGPDIAYLEVAASDDHATSALEPAGPALELRHLPPYESLFGKSGYVTLENASTRIDDDVTDTCVELLTSGTTIPTEEGRRPLAASDIAVLVATNIQARALQARLTAAGVAATLTGSGSVFTTTAARQLRWLLDALERPSSERRVRGALAGWFFRTGPAHLAELDDAHLAALQERLLGWADLLERRGVAAVLRALAAEEGYAERLLARPEGERHLTDVDHLAELLHAAWLGGARRPTELLEVLTTGQVGADERSLDEATRRVDTDDEAVVITTVHAAKGLEFPVVLVPHQWKNPTTPKPWVFHPELGHGRGERGERTVDLASGEAWVTGELGGAGKDERERWAAAEEVEESFRELYVALTRARHRLVVWWPWAGGAAKGWPKGTPSTAASPLGRVLWCTDAEGCVQVDQPGALPAAADATAALRHRLGDPANATVTVVPERAARRRLPAPPPPGDRLDVAQLGRTIDTARRRWSFTALAASSHEHEPLPPAEPDPVGADDEPAEPEAPPEAPVPADLPFEGTPGGTAFGTVVHSVLERTDLAAPDLAGELAAATEEVAWAARWAPHRAAIVAGLLRAAHTPLGPVAAGRALAGTRRRDRLDELTFDLSLPDGASVTAAALGRALVEHLPAGDPLLGYAHELAHRPGQVIAGYLTGSIDLLLRVPGHERFVVVDYKTNHLHRGRPHHPQAAYDPPALAEAMARSDYPLQALLYAVAAHRYLRWRLPGRPTEELVPSVAYLFLRGMTGPDAAGRGVFTWDLPAAAVLAASDVLAGGR